MAIPGEIKKMLQALAEGPRKLDQTELMLCANRDAMKMNILLEKMKLMRLAQLTPEQRDWVSLGWLCSSLHVGEKNLSLVADGKAAIGTIALAVSAHNVPLQVFYDVQEQVVINYLDTNEFSHTGPAKNKLFTQNIELMRASETRLHKIMKARGDDEDEEEDEDVFASSFSKPTAKKKKVLN